MKQYTVRDTESSLDTVLLRAEYTPHASSLPVHQSMRSETSSRMLHELLSSKEELASLSSYPLTIPSLNMFTFGNTAIICTICFVLIVLLCLFCYYYRRWKKT